MKKYLIPAISVNVYFYSFSFVNAPLLKESNVGVSDAYIFISDESQLFGGK